MMSCLDGLEEEKENTKRIRLEAALYVKKLSENATLPTRGSTLAAGYDLYRYSVSSL